MQHVREGLLLLKSKTPSASIAAVADRLEDLEQWLELLEGRQKSTA
ncbi:hypothetical protein SynBIOSE41_01111 [Synechococcus sp. BIOS-E4-1]|nr:hypothetical protein SynBIOSE41_01111 [Synechococcus sp. BIOS-E4-1]